MADEYEDGRAAAQRVVDRRQAELDKGLSVAPAHTVGGLPTTLLSGLHPQEQALHEAQAMLQTIDDEHSGDRSGPASAFVSHAGYPNAQDAITCGQLDQYRGRGALVTRGTDNVLIEVDGKIVAMVLVPPDSSEAAERDELERYLAG